MFKLENSEGNTFLQERKVNLWHSLLFHTIYFNKSGQWRGKYLRNHNVFHKVGENVYYHPRRIPADAFMISIGNNVVIAADVKFIVHDVFGILFNNLDIRGGYDVFFAPLIKKMCA